MGALLYNVLEKAPENTIWRMKSLKWIMDQTINYSMIHLPYRFLLFRQEGGTLLPSQI